MTAVEVPGTGDPRTSRAHWIGTTREGSGLSTEIAVESDQPALSSS